MSIDRWMDKEVVVDIHNGIFSSVQSLSHVQLFETPWTAAHQASLFITNSYRLLKLMSIESVMSSNHLILCHPLLLQYFPAKGSFQISQFFASGGQSIGVSPLASVLPMNIQDWFPSGLIGCIVLQTKGLWRVLRHYSSKASTVWCSAFFIVQLSPPYLTTGKTRALTRRPFVGKVTSPLFNMLSRLTITFLPRSKRLLISWLQSVTICSDFGAAKNKVS